MESYRQEISTFREYHCCAVGIEVKALPLKRKPRTATLPELTANWADPRLPVIPDNPDRFHKNASTLAPGARGREDVPMMPPDPLQTVMATVTATVLGFAMATPVA